ncbi:MAG: hypothetical protein U1E86_21930 [Burkholderiaceae bacterium]
MAIGLVNIPRRDWSNNQFAARSARVTQFAAMKKTSAGAAAGPARGSARAAARGAPRRPPAARKNGAARAPAGPGAPVRERIVEAGLALLRAEGAAGLRSTASRAPRAFGSRT